MTIIVLKKWTDTIEPISNESLKKTSPQTSILYSILLATVILTAGL